MSIMTEGQLKAKIIILSGFKCYRCGSCCKGNIQVFPHDINRLTKYLKMKIGAFRLKYVIAAIDLIGMRGEYISRDNNLCPFFNDGRCSVYEARPDICRIYPFDLGPILHAIDKCHLAKDIYEWICSIIGPPVRESTGMLSAMKEGSEKLFGNSADSKDDAFLPEVLEDLAKEMQAKKEGCATN